MRVSNHNTIGIKGITLVLKQYWVHRCLNFIYNKRWSLNLWFCCMLRVPSLRKTYCKTVRHVSYRLSGRMCDLCLVHIKWFRNKCTTYLSIDIITAAIAANPHCVTWIGYTEEFYIKSSMVLCCCMNLKLTYIFTVFMF